MDPSVTAIPRRFSSSICTFAFAHSADTSGSHLMPRPFVEAGHSRWSILMRISACCLFTRRNGSMCSRGHSDPTPDCSQRSIAAWFGSALLTVVSRPPKVALRTFSPCGFAICTTSIGQYLVRPLVVVEQMIKDPSPSKIPAAYAIGLSSGGSEQTRHVFEKHEAGLEDPDGACDIIP